MHALIISRTIYFDTLYLCTFRIHALYHQLPHGTVFIRAVLLSHAETIMPSSLTQNLSDEERAELYDGIIRLHSFLPRTGQNKMATYA
jgi:hypothetical protein